jgi:hypothetical protein
MHTCRVWCTPSTASRHLQSYTVCRTLCSCGGTFDHAFPCSFELLTTADSMIFFVLAFFTECFHNSSAVPSVPVSVAALIVLVLVGLSCHTLGNSNFSAECGLFTESVLMVAKWIKELPRWIPAAVRSLFAYARQLVCLHLAHT